MHPDDLPVELEIDLLVDGELTDIRRRALLTQIDRQPQQWRDVALRFLSQQTEKESVKALMQGGRLVPAELLVPALEKKPVIGKIGWYRISSIAAALAIAAGSALVTLWLTHAPPTAVTPGKLASAEHRTSLRADLIDAPSDMAVSVPLVPVKSETPAFPVGMPGNNRGTKTSYIVESDGKGGVIVIPVSTTRTPVY